MTAKRTEISELGEFGLIERIAAKTTLKDPGTVMGIGDDAAVINGDNNEIVKLLTSDMLLEGIHFDLTYFPLNHLGYKIIAVNVSDIAAMNGIPKQVILNIGLSNRFSVEAIDALYEGIHAACKNYKVDLVGGDTTSSASGLVISATVLGEVKKEMVVFRNGAKEGDILCVTGDLGAAYVGLQVLEREKQVFLSNPEMQPQLDQYQYIVQRQLKPEARMDIIHELRELELIPTSMIDISDGLASEIFHLCEKSGTGMTLYEENIPVDKQSYDTAFEFNLDSLTCVLNGGEDYELLFTIKKGDQEKLKKHPDIHFIGQVEPKDKGIHLITKNKNVVPLKAQGWEHFKKDPNQQDKE